TDYADSCVKVLADLDVDLAPMVAGRTDLKDDIRRHRQVAAWQRSARDLGVTVECHVSAAHRVGIMLGDYTRVIAHNMAQLVLFGEVAKQSHNFRANLTVTWHGHVHGNDFSSNQLGGLAVVLQQTELVRGQQLGHGGHVRRPPVPMILPLRYSGW